MKKMNHLGTLTAITFGFLMAAQVSAGGVRPPFDEIPKPPVPDYAQESSWAALPMIQDAADQIVENDPFGDRQAQAEVDVFYIHPTTYRGQTWNQDISDHATNKWTDESVMGHQAGAFNACCRVYAPRYRQAATGAVFSKDGSGEQAYDLAYEDVKRAFDHYVTHYNEGRPFMLAGHSQGGRHLVKLLEEIRSDKDLMARFVAGYPIGYGVSMGETARGLKGISVCGTSTEVGCILSWNAFDVKGDAGSWIARTEGRYVARYGTEEGKTAVCVNPLTFDLSHPSTTGGANLQVKSATCRDGVLWVELGDAKNLMPLPGGSLHMNDMTLFYENLRRDAVVRAEAFGKN